MSPGTAKTAIEALGKSGKIRRNGRIVDLPIGHGCREIDFGRGPKLAMPIPWGDVATAFYTTGIPNITVFTPVSPSLLALARVMNAFRFILRSRHVQGRSATPLLPGQSWQWPLAHHVEPRPLFVAQRSVEVLEVGTNCLD